jgi:hypothetical protein
VFTARYALSPYIKQIRFVFKGLISHIDLGHFHRLFVGEKLIFRTLALFSPSCKAVEDASIPALGGPKFPRFT